MAENPDEDTEPHVQHSSSGHIWKRVWAQAAGVGFSVSVTTLVLLPVVFVIKNNMGILFVLVSFVALVVLAVGLVRPSIVKLASRGKVTLWYGGAFAILLILGIATTPANDVPTPVVTAPVPVQTASDSKAAAKPIPAPVSDNTASKAQAQKDLDEVMTLAKNANLVTSYEFSDRATVVYAGSVWYTQSVSFKKDFMAKVATLKKIITGYAHFEVRDANSNEKVGEVTAFSQSLEVYK